MPIFRIPWFVQQLFPNWIWRGGEKNALYLTFDDGPGAEHSDWILSCLKEHNIKATFFCVGEASQNNPLILNQIISEIEWKRIVKPIIPTKKFNDDELK